MRPTESESTCGSPALRKPEEKQMLRVEENLKHQKTDGHVSWNTALSNPITMRRASVVKIVDDLAGESHIGADYPVGTVVISGDSTSDQGRAKAGDVTTLRFLFVFLKVAKRF